MSAKRVNAVIFDKVNHLLKLIDINSKILNTIENQVDLKSTENKLFIKLCKTSALLIHNLDEVS